MRWILGSETDTCGVNSNVGSESAGGESTHTFDGGLQGNLVQSSVENPRFGQVCWENQPLNTVAFITNPQQAQKYFPSLPYRPKLPTFSTAKKKPAQIQLPFCYPLASLHVQRSFLFCRVFVLFLPHLVSLRFSLLIPTSTSVAPPQCSSPKS